MRVFESDHTGAGEVHVVVAVHVFFHRRRVQGAIFGVEAAQLQRGEHGRAALLVVDDVRLGVQEDLVAPACVGVQGGLIAHGSRRHVQAGLFAEELRGALLQ